ncbi:MAG: methionyl-tRNA formyltransferase [Gemmatimonadales bacterium]
MRIIFWGTPEFAIPSLRALDDEGFDVVAVVTQPDRPAGRGRRPKTSAVKSVALDLGIEVLDPDRPRGPELLDRIRALEPDLSVVVAYGHILGLDVLAVPRMGSINVHASLLPDLRGAAPINWAIARGHDTTGVTIMRMAKEMDAGAIIHQVEEPILADETASELSVRLSELGAEALVEALALLSAGAVQEREQDHAAATFAPKIDRDTARIDWSRTAVEISRHVRAMDEIPGAWTTLSGEPLKLFRPRVEAWVGARADAGTVLSVDGALLVASGGGVLAFAEVQPAGGRRMSTVDWLRGRRVEAGAKLG